MACFRWWCSDGNEMPAARVLKFGSKCAFHTPFFAKHTEKTIDASITAYHRTEKTLVPMARHRDIAICVLFPGPDPPAGRRTKTTGPTTPPRHCFMIISIPLSANIEGMRIGLKKKRKAKKNLRESKGQYLEIFQVEAECPNGLLLLKLKHP